MKVQIEDLSPIKKKMQFEVPREAFEKALEKSYQKLQKKAQIKGFRKGKVPRSILEKYYGAETHRESLGNLIDQTYRDAIQQHQVPAVGLPKIDDFKMEEGQPITFSAEVEVQPKIQAKDYVGLELKVEKHEVSDEEIRRELEGVRKSQAQQVPAGDDEAAGEGYLATIDYAGTLDGVPFEGGTDRNVPVELGAGRFLPDFEKGIVGMKKGESRDIDVNFPADYGHEPLRGRQAKFKIDLKELKKISLPEIDDDFAKDLGKYESLDQLKNEIREHLLRHKESQGKAQIFKQVLDQLIAKNSFEIPESMIERELDYMLDRVNQQLAQQKLSLEQLGLTPQKYREENREEAIRRIKGFLLFESIAEQNQLEVKEEDLEQAFAEQAEHYRQPVEVIKRQFQEQGLVRMLVNQILEKKTFDFLMAKAKMI